MADEQQYQPGKADETGHGWAPDAPGTGAAKDRVIEANRKAFEGNPTQEASRGDESNPALDAEGVGESVTRRGEDSVKTDGPDEGRVDLGTKGPSERPYGTSTSAASTGVDPQQPADPRMSDTQSGDQGG